MSMCEKIFKNLNLEKSKNVYPLHGMDRYIGEAKKFKEAVLDEKDKLVFVFFGKPSNQESLKIIEKIEEKLKVLKIKKIVKIHMLQYKITASYFNIKNDPTLLIYENGKLLWRFNNPLDFEKILKNKELLNKLKIPVSKNFSNTTYANSL